jgi:SAM-dependent methyltransferase
VTYDGRGLKFGTVAEQYDAFRPSPPPEAANILGDLSATEILEVAAGTGLWTRFLIDLGASVTVVEPDDDMRAVLTRRSPEVRALKGSAEALPLDDASFDAVLVSSAWHWFTQPNATIEMARVLRDDGLLYVLWNGFSRDVAWLNALITLREGVNDENKRPRGWGADFGDDNPFILVSQVHVDWNWTRTVEQMVSLFGTYSGAIIRDDDGRRAMEEEIRHQLADHVVDGSVEVPMTIRGSIGRRSPRS